MLSKIKNKSLLLDTCIIIESARDLVREKSFNEHFYSQVKSNNITPLIDDTIELEFLRGANTKEALIRKRTYLEKFLGESAEFILPVNKEIITSARRISNLYRFCNVKEDKISLADCLIAAQIKKYNHSVFLATLNHSDFPIDLFDRVCLVPISAGRNVFSIGIYGFSLSKYDELVTKFVTSIFD